MSIPHDVRNTAAVRLRSASPATGWWAPVVVVAAAGNRAGTNRKWASATSFPARHRSRQRPRRDHGRLHHPSNPIYTGQLFLEPRPDRDGRAKPDLIAPGEGIRAPIRNEAEGELSGTSMAAPFVSGAAAMVMARHPEMVGQPLEVKSTLCKSATDLERERYFQGHGLLDVLRAIQSR